MFKLKEYSPGLSDYIRSIFNGLHRSALLHGYKPSWAWFRLTDKENPLFSYTPAQILSPLQVLLFQQIEFNDSDLFYIQQKLEFKKGWIFFAKKTLKENSDSWTDFLDCKNEEWLNGEECLFSRQDFIKSRESSKKQSYTKRLTVSQQIALDYFKLTEPFSKQDIKKAYRAKSLKHHPDIGGDKSEFIRATEMKNILMAMV